MAIYKNVDKVDEIKKGNLPIVGFLVLFTLEGHYSLLTWKSNLYQFFLSETLCLDVSDTINIVFLKSRPSINKPLIK